MLEGSIHKGGVIADLRETRSGGRAGGRGFPELESDLNRATRAKGAVLVASTELKISNVHCKRKRGCEPFSLRRK